MQKFRNMLEREHPGIRVTPTRLGDNIGYFVTLPHLDGLPVCLYIEQRSGHDPVTVIPLHDGEREWKAEFAGAYGEVGAHDTGYGRFIPVGKPAYGDTPEQVLGILLALGPQIRE